MVASKFTAVDCTTPSIQIYVPAGSTGEVSYGFDTVAVPSDSKTILSK